MLYSFPAPCMIIDEAGRKELVGVRTAIGDGVCHDDGFFY